MLRRSLALSSLVVLAVIPASVAADVAEVSGTPTVTVGKSKIDVSPELVVTDQGGDTATLDAIAAALVGDLTRKIEIDAYAAGADAKQAKQASLDHAGLVRDQLVARGLLPEQFVVKGMGARDLKGRSAFRVELLVVGKIALPAVRPPVAADLAGYVNGMTGSGDLVATLDTSEGTIHCKLLDKEAPMTVANFIGLATGKKAWKHPTDGKLMTGKPFYDGTVFHRVIPNFMIQGGDVLGTGTGYPGYRFPDEVAAGLTWEPGTLAMANAGPNTNGSQFFITEAAPTYLGGGYTIFGRCTDVDVVKQIARVPRDSRDKPKAAVTLKKVTIARTAP
nr:peptidylprolyl isomerase [Kofleriaceae bacterium]